MGKTKIVFKSRVKRNNGQIFPIINFLDKVGEGDGGGVNVFWHVFQIKYEPNLSLKGFHLYIFYISTVIFP